MTPPESLRVRADEIAAKLFNLLVFQKESASFTQFCDAILQGLTHTARETEQRVWREAAQCVLDWSSDEFARIRSASDKLMATEHLDSIAREFIRRAGGKE